jgi:transcription antitermination factor NusG
MEVQRRKCWLAAYTRSRHEHHVANQLRSKDLEFLLPMFERMVRWSDRIKRSSAPLFPGYVFVHVSDSERVPVLQTVGVVNLVGSGGRAAVLQDEEVERLRACCLRPSGVEPYPYLQIGHRVRVKHGPFAGWEGTLVEKSNARRLIISVHQIMKSIAINIHGADVESVR